MTTTMMIMMLVLTMMTMTMMMMMMLVSVLSGPLLTMCRLGWPASDAAPLLTTLVPALDPPGSKNHLHHHLVSPIVSRWALSPSCQYSPHWTEDW